MLSPLLEFCLRLPEALAQVVAADLHEMAWLPCPHGPHPWGQRGCALALCRGRDHGLKGGPGSLACCCHPSPSHHCPSLPGPSPPGLSLPGLSLLFHYRGYRGVDLERVPDDSSCCPGHPIVVLVLCSPISRDLFPCPYHAPAPYRDLYPCPLVQTGEAIAPYPLYPSFLRGILIEIDPYLKINEKRWIKVDVVILSVRHHMY